MNTVAYLRYSPRPEDNDSLMVQYGIVEAYCESMGLNLVAVFMDPEVSARKTQLKKRPGGKAMLDYMKREGIKHIVCKSLERMFRNVDDGRAMGIHRWPKEKVSVHFAQHRSMLDVSTAMGRFLFTTMLNVAELEPAQTAERTSQAKRHHQKQGRRTGRFLDYGYENDTASPCKLVKSSTGETRTLYSMMKPCAEEQENIRRVLELRGMDFGYQQIADWFNERRIRYRGKRWDRNKVVGIIKAQQRKEAG